MKERMTVKEAAEFMGLTPAYIRYQMELGKLDIGTVVKRSTPHGRHRYLISRRKVLAWAGKEPNE